MAAAQAHLLARGVAAGPLTEGPGVRYFRFTDPDGNPLEACEVLPDAASIAAEGSAAAD